MSERLLLSSAQLGIWYAQKLSPESAEYNVGEYLEIHGRIDPDVLQRALSRVVEEVQTLRIRIEEVADQVWQIADEEPAWKLDYLNVSGETDPFAAALTAMRKEISRPIGLTDSPLFRFSLFKLGDEHFIWSHINHHIAIDGYGGSLIARRVAVVYSALALDESVPNHQFAQLDSLMEDEDAYLASPQSVVDREYWRTQLNSLGESCFSPTRRVSSDGRVVRASETWETADANELCSAARAAGVSWIVAVVAALAVYQQRLTGEDEVVVKLLATARSGESMRNAPGTVANVLPIRLAIDPRHQTVRELFRHVSREMRAALRHQRYRYEGVCTLTGVIDDHGRDIK